MYFSCLRLDKGGPQSPGHPCVLLKWGMTHTPAISFSGGLGDLSGRGPVTPQSNRIELLCPHLPSLCSPLPRLHLLKSLNFSRERENSGFRGSVPGREPRFQPQQSANGVRLKSCPSSWDGWNEATLLTPGCRALLCCSLGEQAGKFLVLRNLFKITYFSISLVLFLRD